MNKTTTANHKNIQLLEILLQSYTEEEREAFVNDAAFLNRLLWLNFRAALYRMKSPHYMKLYEDQHTGKNLYTEGFLDGMEAGLKAAGVVVDFEEEIRAKK